MDLSDVLTLARVSREAAALMVGVSKQSIDNWCSGRAVPRLEHLSSLAIALLRDGTVTQRDIRFWVTSELARSGMHPDALALLCGGGSQPSDRPIVVVGSGSYTASFQTMARAISEQSRARGASDVVYLDFCGRNDLLNQYMDILRQWSIRGAILVALPLEDAEFFKIGSDIARDAPCVFIQNGPIDLPPGCGYVDVGNQEASMIVTETLWSKGHRKIMAIAIGESTSKNAQQGRIDGYRIATERLGGKSRVLLTSGLADGHTFGPPSDKPELREAIDLIVADNDYTAFMPLSAHAVKQLTRALNRKGLMPGRDVSVMTLGCWDWMHYVSSPPLSHLALPYSDAGRRALDMVLDISSVKRAIHEANVVNLHPDRKLLHFVENGTIFELAAV